MRSNSRNVNWKQIFARPSYWWRKYLKLSDGSVEGSTLFILTKFSRFKYSLAAVIASVQILIFDLSIQDIYGKGWLIAVVYPLVILLHAASFKAAIQIAIPAHNSSGINNIKSAKHSISWNKNITKQNLDDHHSTI